MGQWFPKENNWSSFLHGSFGNLGGQPDPAMNACADTLPPKCRGHAGLMTVWDHTAGTRHQRLSVTSMKLGLPSTVLLHDEGTVALQGRTLLSKSQSPPPAFLSCGHWSALGSLSQTTSSSRLSHPEEPGHTLQLGFCSLAHNPKSRPGKADIGGPT